MAQRNGSNDRAGELHLEIIDERGQVIDHIYIREIAPGSGPVSSPRVVTDPGFGRRDD